MTLTIANLRKTFTEDDGSEFVVLDDINFEVADGEFTSLMGPSGCGKSTLLNILAGIIPMDEGELSYNGTTVAPAELPIGYVFQEPRLLNWRTVEKNISIAMSARGIPEQEHEAVIDETLEMVGLRDEKTSYPLRLSGGMRQRVGIARALAVDSDILLMDEPFSELDELTARELRQDLLDLWQQTGKTILFVTHDMSEAIFLADTIKILDTRGRLFKQVEVPHERPRDPDDPALLETEAEIMDEFFAHMEQLQPR